MKKQKLTREMTDFIRRVYDESSTRKEAQKIIAEEYGVTKRTVRRWANDIEVGLLSKNVTNPFKILVYDIETSRVPAMVWWTGKQYVGGEQLREEPKIISICAKWLGDDKVHTFTWDKNQSDEKMLKEFLNLYNDADMVVGQNNDNFDNRWVNARAMKYGLDINTYVRSFDLMKESKRLFRIPSYSLSYICKYLGMEGKYEHEGVKMWDKIQFGTPEEQEEYLKKMCEYNAVDVIRTEEVYLRLRKYMGHKVHFGVLGEEPKFTCPNCGGKNIELYKTTVTPAGTVQRIMRCKDDEVKYKITNKQYMEYLDYKMKRNGY